MQNMVFPTKLYDVYLTCEQCSFNMYLLNVHYVSGPVLGAEDRIM